MDTIIRNSIRSMMNDIAEMSFEFILPLIAFAFVTSITPGPNNLMLMASGANFGFARTIPHMLGVGLGFVFMAAIVGLGLAEVFERVPLLHTVLLVACIGYLLWLAWRIANAGNPGQSAASARPLTFVEAAAFQWVNPKAWAMALTAVTVYSPGHGIWSALAVAGIFGAVNLPSVSTWCLLGVRIRALLTNPARLKGFNYLMAGLLVVSMVPVML